MDLSANFLESLLEAPPEQQYAFVDQVRDMEVSRAKVKEQEEERQMRIEELWLRVPKWRRALILLLDKLQYRLAPRWFRGAE